MLNNIPPILSPELLKVLCEMGHGDRICIGDGNFPGVSMAKPNNCVFLRADGHGVPELLDAILQVIPLDEYVEHPVMIMQVAEKDNGLERPPSAATSASSSTTRPARPTASCSPARRPSTRTSSSRRASSSKNGIKSGRITRIRPFFCLYYTVAAGSRLVMLLRLMARVEALCSRAEVVGGRMPATPKMMRPRLKPTIVR